MNFSFTVGQDGTSANDRFDFSLSSTTSASNALVMFNSKKGPVHADAFFRATLTLFTMGPIDKAVDGYFGLPDMPTLHSLTETMTAKVTKGPYSGPTTLATLIPGDTGVEVPLTMATWDQQFTYTFTYEIVTPYGTDPTYAYALSGVTGSAAAVPEPSTYAAIFGSLALVGTAIVRRRKKALKADNP